jgi:DNA polymerase V
MSSLTSITESAAASQPLEFAEAIRAGFPSPAYDHAGERIAIIHDLSPHPTTTFYARVQGDSMRDAGIIDGDIVVVDRGRDAQSGNFVVACIDGEFTIKEFRLDPSGQCAWLVPHNPDFQPIQVTAESNFQVWGVITFAIHKTRS